MMKRSPSSRLNGKSSASGSSPMGSRKKGTQNQHHERVGLSRATENCNPNSRTLALPRRATTTTFSKPSPKKPLFPKGSLFKTQNPDKTGGGGGENPDKGPRIHRRIASFHDAIIARNGDDGVGNSFRDDTRLSLQTPSRVFRTCSFREHPNAADSEIHHRDNNNTKKEGRVKHLVRAFEKLLSGKEENSDDHAAGTADDQEPPKDKKGSGAGGAGKRIMKWAQNKFQGHSKGNRTTPIKELPSCQPNAASCSSPVNHFVTHRRTVSTSSAAYHFADYHYDESASQASLGSPLSFSSKRRMFSGKSSDFESQGTDEWRRQLKATAAKPFNLRTEQRGAAKEEEFKKKIQEMNTEEDKLRIPVAQGLPWTTDEPQSLVKPAVKESTKPVDLKLYTDVRAVERAEFDHVIADKSRQIEEERIEQERLQKVLAEEEETKRIRKYLIPRAQPMPFFDRPFVPKRSGKPPTIPQDPKFKNPNLNHKRARSMQSYSELYGSLK